MRPRPGWAVALTVVLVCVPSAGTAADAGVQVTAADVASLGTVAAVAGWVAVARRPLPAAAIAAFGPVVALLGLTTLLSQDVVASLPGAVRFVQLFVLVPLAVMVAAADRRDAAVIAGGVVCAGVVQAVVGLWQVATRNGASYGGERIRAVGTFGATDVMGASTVVAFGIIVCLSFLLAGGGRRSLPVRAAACAALALQAAALLASLSRGAWIAVLAATAVMLLAHDAVVLLRTAVVAVASVVVLAFGFGLGGRTLVDRGRSIAAVATSPDRSVSDRYALWGTATGIWRDYPLTGTGIKNFPAYRDSYAGLRLSGGSETEDPVHGYRKEPLLSPHNQYLLVAAEQGLAGLAAFAALLLALLAGLWRNRDRRDPRWLAAAGFLTWLLVDFCYADIGGPTSVLMAIMLGSAATAAWPPPAGAAR